MACHKEEPQMTLKVGMFAMPVHPPEKDFRALLDENIEKVVLADQLGFTEYYMGEHHTSHLERIGNPLIFFAAVADKTKNIRLGSGVINLPQQHPAAVASNVALLDQITNGRFILGVGPGSLVTDIEAFGSVPPEVRGRMVFESIDMITKIWTTKPPYELKGEFWNIALKDKLMPEYGVGDVPMPKQTPHPPIAMTMVAPKSYSARVAGRNNWIPISASFINRRFLKSHWESYVEGCDDVGRKPDPSTWRICRCVLVTDSESEAKEYLADPSSSINYHYRFFREIAIAGRGSLGLLKPDLDKADEATTQKEIVDAQVIAGTPKSVVDQLHALRKEVGDFGTLVMTSFDWDRPGMWKRSMELLANEVAPRT
jgi:alkanesulfonate monooxygenase SsuD/methylene tetrahydromethanopterin reductase-like flavin-dependent oxidoreductase (luciferase family)